LLANLNTDDPTISGIDLPHEYCVAARMAGMTPEMTRKSQLNAVEMAYLPALEKTGLLQKKASLRVETPTT
jgi:adenosine deaminase